MSIILGLVQGLTEFLPVSSSGHLVFLHKIFNFNLHNNLSFDVALHWGTLLALLIYFGKDLWNLFFVWLKSIPHVLRGLLSRRHLVFAGMIGKRNRKNGEAQIKIACEMDRRNLYWEERLVWGMLVGTIPVVLVGYYLENYIELMFRNLLWVGLALVVVGIFFFVAEKKWQSPGGTIDNITVAKAFGIGLMQVLALLPGVSRSGITIIAGMKQHLNRYAAARFSFLLSVPAVFGAGVKELVDFGRAGDFSQTKIMLVGFLSSMIVGYFCVKYFLKFLEKYSLNIFAWYRIILGLVILFLALS